MPKVVRPVLLAVACAIAVAACGSSATSSSSASSGEPAALKFSECMRAHGVPGFPDLSASGGVFGQQIARSGINPESPAFQSAMSACQRLGAAAKAAVGGPGYEARKVELVRLAECMRAHGLTTFPDPTTSAPSAPSAPPSGEGIAYTGPGGSVSLSVPLTMMQSPAFKQAAAACGFPGPGGAKQAAAG